MKVLCIANRGEALPQVGWPADLLPNLSSSGRSNNDFRSFTNQNSAEGAPGSSFEPGSFDFSTHFHSRNKPITPLPTPSNLSTSLHPIRIRPSRSNESFRKKLSYWQVVTNLLPSAMFGSLPALIVFRKLNRCPPFPSDLHELCAPSYPL